MTEDFTGQRIVVTAAASGIGRAIAEGFLAAGARLHVCDLDGEGLAAFRAAAPGLGTTVADVADPAAVDRLFDDAEAHLGGLDVLINNAGIAGPSAPVEAVEPAEWQRTIAVNLNGCFYCSRRAVPLLKRAGGGAIVFISSTAGLSGVPLRSPYTASKWALIGLTKTLAMELGEQHIRVNAVCPGSVAGERIERVVKAEARTRGTSSESVRDAYLRQVSMRTFVTAEDVTRTVLFLCSAAGERISGQALAVDGHTETLRS